MNRKTSDLAPWSRSTQMVVGTIGLTLSAAVLAPLAFGGPAGPGAGPDLPRVHRSSTVVAQETPAPTQQDVTSERGLALSGWGALDGRRVFVEVYGNDRHGSQATVVVEQPGGPDLVAHTEPTVDDLLDGDLHLDLPLGRATRSGHVATRLRAEVDGTWMVSGPSREVDETYEDAGYLVRTTGTNTPLAARLTVTVDEEQATVEMHDAFTFDLTVTRTPL